MGNKRELCPFKESAFALIIKKLNHEPYKIFYERLISPKIRKRLENTLEHHITPREVARWWHNTIRWYFDNNQPELFKQIKIKKKLATEKIIWQYWAQGIDDDIPDIVRLCFHSVDKYCGDYQIIRLTRQGINEYLEFPSFILEKYRENEISHTFFSDLLRIVLLYHYGGVWIDATILLTKEIEKDILSSELFIFSRDKLATNKIEWEFFNEAYFGWKKKHLVNHLSSFMVSQKGNVFLKDCINLLLIFWKTNNVAPYYFFFQIMLNELLKYKFYEFSHVDDTLPHQLQRKLYAPFNLDEYNHIIKEIGIHKLTYIDKLNEPPSDSYYQFLLKTQNSESGGGYLVEIIWFLNVVCSVFTLISNELLPSGNANYPSYFRK